MAWYFIGVYLINSTHYMGTWRKEIFSCSKNNIFNTQRDIVSPSGHVISSTTLALPVFVQNRQ